MNTQIDPFLTQMKEQTDKLTNTLRGIASCATQCPCCEMHRQLASKALGYSPEPLYTVVLVTSTKDNREVMTAAASVGGAIVALPG